MQPQLDSEEIFTRIKHFTVILNSFIPFEQANRQKYPLIIVQTYESHYIHVVFFVVVIAFCCYYFCSCMKIKFGIEGWAGQRVENFVKRELSNLLC